jgi:hypothetical protein
VQLAPLLPPQKPRTGRPAKPHRVVVEGILWALPPWWRWWRAGGGARFTTVNGAAFRSDHSSTLLLRARNRSVQQPTLNAGLR